MKELLTGISTFVTASASGPLTSTITGGVHLHKAPSRKSVPYATVHPVSAPVTAKYGGISLYSEPEIQFNVWDRKAATALATIGALMTAFDGDGFTLIGRTKFHLTRVNDPLPLPDSPAKDEDGNDIWGWFVSYRYAVA